MDARPRRQPPKDGGPSSVRLKQLEKKAAVQVEAKVGEHADWLQRVQDKLDADAEERADWALTGREATAARSTVEARCRTKAKLRLRSDPYRGVGGGSWPCSRTLLVERQNLSLLVSYSPLGALNFEQSPAAKRRP